MINRFFDFEVFRGWWLCVMIDYCDTWELDEKVLKRSAVSINSDMPNARDLLMSAFKEDGVVIMGYNIKRYDLVITNAIYNGFDAHQVKIINDMIINPSCTWDDNEHIMLQAFAKKIIRSKDITYQDLFDDESGSLKEKEMLLGLSIIECDVPFDKENLTDEEKEAITYYCIHDVYACVYFYKHVKCHYINAKLALAKTFGIDERTCYMKTNAQLCALVLDAKHTSYLDEERTDIVIPSSIKEYIYDNLPTTAINHLTNFITGFETNIFNNTVNFGNGGLHSVLDTNVYLEEDCDYGLMNMDVSSFYPALLINYNVLSRSCRNKARFKEIYLERLEIKNKKNPTPTENKRQYSYKLVLNTAYGASGNKFLAMYDPYMTTCCCRYGQLLLSALANNLYKNVPTLQIVQSNTDGICLYYPKKDFLKVKAIADNFMSITNMGLEFDYIKKIWQRDVNNYLWIDSNGEEKCKGRWLNTTIIKKDGTLGALNEFICARAAKEYLLRDKDIVQTIVNCNDISEFVLSCVKGPSYRYVVHNVNGEEIKVNKCNRVIATNNNSYGGLFKVKFRKDVMSYGKIPSTPDHCLLFNDALSSYNFEDIKPKIDYMWYVEKTINLLDINWQTLIDNKLENINLFKYE